MTPSEQILAWLPGKQASAEEVGNKLDRTMGQARKVLDRMVNNGTVRKIEGKDGKRTVVRYEVTGRDPPKRKPPGSKIYGRGRLAGNIAKEARSNAAKTHQKPRGEAIDDGVRVQVIPTPSPRYASDGEPGPFMLDWFQKTGRLKK